MSDSKSEELGKERVGYAVPVQGTVVVRGSRRNSCIPTAASVQMAASVKSIIALARDFAQAVTAF